LKSHAVTLYEAGKLGHACIADLCKDLSTLEGAKFEGELEEFANHAFSLHCVLECLQSGGVASDAKVGEDKMDMATVSIDESSSLISEISLTDKSGDSGITDAGMNNYDMLSSDLEKTVEPSASDEAAPRNMIGGTCSIPFEGDGSHVQEDIEDGNLQNDEKPMVQDSDVGTEMLKRKKKYRVDILRCESLASLAPATLDRLFVRDYDVVVSIVPLPHSSVLPGSTGLVHFGPPTYSFMTPWMKLVLYSTVASGPLSVVLMKGQCLRLLPTPMIANISYYRICNCGGWCNEVHNFGFLIIQILRKYILLDGACRSYALTPVYEAATRSIVEATQANTIKAEADESDSKEVILSGVNLIFDGSELLPFDIGACLQAHQPISLIAKAAAAASASLAIK
ncbi:Protein FAM91A1, partial [Mucuna pruriens]